jgi:curved DNA-binding protein CbpA
MGNNASRGGGGSSTYQQYYTALENPDAVIPKNINPYDVLGVGPNFTWDELKLAYRRAARLAHPDKGGSQKLFEIVTESFRQLGEEYKFRQGGRPHHELKQEAQSYYTEQKERAFGRPESARGGPKTREGIGGGNDPESLDRFNRVFEENRLPDEETERGYADMMEKSNPNREDINVAKTLSGKYSRRKFNEAFERDTLPASEEIIIYREPEPMIAARKMQFTELGAGGTEDYSGGAEEARRGLQYTDYKKAHTTVRLVDPRAVAERKDFKTVDEYEAYRARKTQRQLTDEEQAWLDAKKAKEEAAEQTRLERLRTRDQNVAIHHERMNQLLLR